MTPPKPFKKTTVGKVIVNTVKEIRKVVNPNPSRSGRTGRVIKRNF